MTNTPHSRGTLALCLLLTWLATTTTSQAEKVALSSENWGNPEGKACIDCHSKSSPGIVRQWKDSAHAASKVNCLDCHHADPEDDDAKEHEGAIISTIVSPLDCGRCHTVEYQQAAGSVHSKARMPVEASGGPDSPIHTFTTTGSCDDCHGSRVTVQGDGRLSSASWPNSGIGRINPDGSLGSCSACHSRHQFSRAQARDPGSCTTCHSGLDSPDAEIYQTSKHGILFTVHRNQMNLDSDQWVTGTDYGAAPTCATCHMGAAPGLKATHDVGMRDAWNLYGPVSERQHLVVFQDGERINLPVSQPAPRRGADLEKPAGSLGKVKVVADPKRRRQAMIKACIECHSKGYIEGVLQQFDHLVERYNMEFGRPAKAIMDALYGSKLLSETPFDEPLEFTYRRLWRDAGIRARHGAAMNSANATWWEGLNAVSRIFYESFIPQMLEVAGERKGRELLAKHVTNIAAHRWLQEIPPVNNPVSDGKSATPAGE